MEEFTNGTSVETAEMQETEIKSRRTDKKSKKQRLFKGLVLVAVIVLLLCNLLGLCCRKYDYAIMFSENAVVTLNEIKQGDWEIINARWASNARGVWNYEFVVRRKAPLFGIFGKKPPKQQTMPQIKRSAPQQKPQAQPAPKAGAPKK